MGVVCTSRMMETESGSEMDASETRLLLFFSLVQSMLLTMTLGSVDP